MDDLKKNYKIKLSLYKQKYNWDEKRDEINFNFDPHKNILKNTAIHSSVAGNGNARAFYADFLQAHYPNYVDEELERFDITVNNLQKWNDLNLESFIKKDYTHAIADLDLKDDDVILTLLETAPTGNANSPLPVFNQIVTLQDILDSKRSYVWVDATVVK